MRIARLPVYSMLAGAQSLCAQSLTSPPPDIHVIGRVVATATGFGIADTSVLLRSATVPLSTLNGQVADLRGTLVDGSVPPLLDVLQGQRSASVFTLGNNARIGHSLALRIDDPQSLWWYAFYSPFEGFLPVVTLLPFLDGTLLLDFDTTMMIGNGMLTNGTWQGSVVIPNAPILVGSPLRLQFATVTTQYSVLYVNVAAAVIGP